MTHGHPAPLLQPTWAKLLFGAGWVRPLILPLLQPTWAGWVRPLVLSLGWRGGRRVPEIACAVIQVGHEGLGLQCEGG